MAHPYTPQNEARPTTGPVNAGPSVSDTVKHISDDVKAIVQGEIALAKAELVPSAKHAGVGGGMFAVAGYFALNGLSLLFLAGALGIAKLLSAPTGWIALGFVIMAVIVLIIAGILAMIGVGQVKKVKGPEKTIENANASVATVKSSLARANADAKTAELERKTFQQPSIKS